MNDLGLVDAFFAILVGMGPIKAFILYLSVTSSVSAKLQRRVARSMVLVAVTVAISIELIAVLLMQVLHFTIPALQIAGGLILLALALRMVLGDTTAGETEAPSERQLMQMVVYPLAIPLLLNPIGIVSLSVYSVQVTELVPFLALLGIIAVVGTLDYVILVGGPRLQSILTQERIIVLEKLLGVFIAALSIQLIVDGLAEFGIVTLSGGH